MVKKSERESGIELLRILSMLGVVVLHYNNASMGKAFELAENNSINQLILYLFENIAVCGVNIYVLISGYFLFKTQKRPLIKIFELFLQVILFNIAFYCMSVLMGVNALSIGNFLYYAMPNNYFVVLYAVLYLISPYINLLLNALNKKQLKALIMLSFLFFSVFSFGVDVLEQITSLDFIGLSTIGAYGSQEGYTIVNFVLIYMLGGYIRICTDSEERELSIQKRCIRIFLLLVFIVMCSWTEKCLGYGSCVTWNYNNPFIILLSVCWFTLFKSMKIRSRLINELAKGAFTCFLFHGAFLQFLVNEKVVNGSVILLVLHIAATAIVLYLISYIVYKIYYFCTERFVRKLSSVFKKYSLTEE